MTGDFEVLNMEKKAEYEALLKLRKMVDISKGLSCPSCTNVGWYEHNGEQVQCEFCCTVPDSIYYRMVVKMKDLIAEHG